MSVLTSLPFVFDDICFQVWQSFAQFELSINDSESVKKCRGVYQQANIAMKTADEKEERLMLLEAWKDFEVIFFNYNFFSVFKWIIFCKVL